MSKFFIDKKTKIYVLCPAYFKTGGPELLHQLVNELNKNKIKAYITYYGIDKNNEQYTPDDFKKYIDEYKTFSDIEDENDNIVIAPETSSAIKNTKQIKNAQKIIWWLSVDNFNKTYGLKNSIKNFGFITTGILVLKRQILYDFSYIGTFNQHLCQSHYSMDYLEKNGINNYLYLSDYINEDYLVLNENWKHKEDIVVFNPKKGQKFTKKIIEKGSNLKFVPIQNLTTKQVKELLLKSKVYIDFGNHPGKDRIPREAAMCGCCIITNKQGSANYYEDVPIKEEFKFEDKIENIDYIIEKIDDCINDYDIEIDKFKEYRQFITREKEQFEQDVKNIFLN